ncbi:3988_t:CDS:2 [Rhizophagus irregularis]|nr:3988_t:CDS:2 [Rhizophagus irregularis]
MFGNSKILEPDSKIKKHNSKPTRTYKIENKNNVKHVPNIQCSIESEPRTEPTKDIDTLTNVSLKEINVGIKRGRILPKFYMSMVRPSINASIIQLQQSIYGI